MAEKIRILGFAGSLRKGSLNKAVLNAASKMLPQNAEMEIFDLEGIPLFNQDIEGSLPPQVAEFKKRIKECDALLIVTPEYNYSMTGVLKNAIDWGSRPGGNNSFDGKPAAIMGASNGMTGTARAQGHLRVTLAGLNVFVLPKPEVLVTLGEEKIKGGVLTDEPTKERVKKLMEALVAFAAKMKA
jgi:chromate reductase, NAD(P)H dehydrogenase (quinone)